MKVLVFCITAGLAAVAGALLGSLYNYGLGTNYSSFSSLTMVAIVVLIVMGDPWYAIVAGITFEVIPGYINIGNINYYESMLFGIIGGHLRGAGEPYPPATPGVPQLRRPPGGRQPEAVLGEGELEELVSDAEAEEKRSAGADREWPPRAGGGPGEAGLAVRGCRYSRRVRAVDNVSLEAPMARITGLVGPNGAGKTTTFNACSGLLKPTTGRVLLRRTRRDRGWGRRGGRALGLGRTFQKAELFNSLCRCARTWSWAARPPWPGPTPSPSWWGDVAIAASYSERSTRRWS